MIFEFSLSNVQHIKELDYKLDLSKDGVTCIVGKNSVGKTTLVRTIANFKSADTFTKTASPYIFSDDSKITYTINDDVFEFNYDSKLNTLDTKTIINQKYKDNIEVELPIPYGNRFSQFQRLGEIDHQLRTLISLKDYIEPTELIGFLSKIYGSDRFENLKEVNIKGSIYYFILKEDDYYIREDYLSSGEYFVIHLYKLIQKRRKLIVIDEIDISLDASAQVKLLGELSIFCKKYEVNILFTTQSLALMKSFSSRGQEQLDYMDNDEGKITINKKSYNYVKSILYGFKGWDKYILTEDKILQSYLQFLLKDEPIDSLKYKIIYVAGATNVVSLMKRNATEEFFAHEEHVISILDADQKGKAYCKDNKQVFYSPFEDIEAQLFMHYESGKFGFTVTFPEGILDKNKPKSLYKSIKNDKHMSDNEIFTFINDRNKEEVDTFTKELLKFLS